MPFTPEQKLWLNTHLVDSGRARGDGTEEERARREDNLVSEVTERIELSANATNLSEDVVKIIEDGASLPPVPLVAPVKTDPLYPLLALHPAKPLEPDVTDTVKYPKGKTDRAFKAANKLCSDWAAQNVLFDKAQQVYERDDKARRRLVVAAPVKAAAQARTNDLKTQQPDQYNSLREEAVRKEEAKTGTDYTGDKDVLTDKHLMQVYIVDEIDREISGRIAEHDQKVAASKIPEDPETRLEEIAEIIEDVGKKYEFTNLAHFISRHGAPRLNPDTRETKRTRSDAVARIATGVGPDQVPKAGSKPTTVVTGNVGGQDVDIPEYTHVGGQTAPASSQHASAKAALFMLEEGAAQTSLEEHLDGSDRINAVKVTVGHETIGDDSFVSFPETGGLGDAYQLRTGSAEEPLGKTGAPDSGDVLPKSKIENLLAEIEQTHDQQSAILTNLPNQVLGGHTPITMFSKDATVASTTYNLPGSNKEHTLDKAAATRAKQEKDAIATKATAEKTLATVKKGDTSAKQNQADAQQEQDIAKAALDLAITAPVDTAHEPVIDDVTTKAQEAAKARVKATASAGVEVKATNRKAEVDIEVTKAQVALTGVKATAAQPNSPGGTAKTSEEQQNDALAVQNVEAWVARALGRQTQANEFTTKATAAKLADEKAAVELEGILNDAVNKPGPVPKESLEKVAAHAKATVKVDAAKAEAAMWAAAAVSAQTKVEQADEVVTGFTVQREAKEDKVAEEAKLTAAMAEEAKATQDETDAKQKQTDTKNEVDLVITSPIDPAHQLLIDAVALKAKALAEADIEAERLRNFKTPNLAEKKAKGAAFKLAAVLKGELAELVKTAGPVPQASLDKIAAHAQAVVMADAATVETGKKSAEVVDAQTKVDAAEAKLREVTDDEAIFAAELVAERLARDTQAKDLAKGGGATARKNLTAYEAEELKAIDEMEASMNKDTNTLADKTKSGPTGKDAAAVEKMLKAEAAARAAIQAKAIERARAEVRNRVAAAIASAPDASPDEIKEATRTKARYEFAEAEARLAETISTVDGAKGRLAKATDARDKAVAATKGKTVNTSQTEFLANVERRAVDARNVVDELEKVGGPLKLAEQEVIAMKQALDLAEST